jgi:predicted DNA-binding ribbon-helix-helix protein
MTGQPRPDGRKSPDDRKRSVTIAGHRTSVSLEDEFWQALAEIAGERGLSTTRLIAEIDEARNDRGLSAAIRVFVLNHYQERREAGPG